MTDRAADERAILARFDLQGLGWRTGDADLFATVFSEDAEFFNITSQVLRGRAEIASHHAQLWKTVYAGLEPEITERVVRFVHPDVATVTSRAVIRMPQGDRHAHMLAVWVRKGEAWEMTAAHNMVPFVPPAAPA